MRIGFSYRCREEQRWGGRHQYHERRRRGEGRLEYTRVGRSWSEWWQRAESGHRRYQSYSGNPRTCSGAE